MFRRYVAASAFVGAATTLGLLVREELAAPDHVMLYLLAIALVAASLGRGPAFAASALSVLSYDYFFVPPYRTFAVQDQRYLLTFAVMFGVGVVVSAVTSRLKRDLGLSRMREERVARLYELSRELGAARDDGEVASVVARHAARAFAGHALVLLPRGGAGVLTVRGDSASAPPLDESETNAARWAFDHGKPAGQGTATEPESGVLCVPIRSGLLECLGVLALRPMPEAPRDTELRRLADVFARQAALGLERARLAEAARAAALRARTEEVRSSLLSAVSHDLRTPLGTITGAATALREGNSGLSSEARADLVGTICEEATRLERLVANLLEMTRLESGGVHPNREWVPLEEVIGPVLARLDSLLAGHRVSIDVPPTLPLMFVDPISLEQLLLNLLENAGKHTPPGTEIELVARSELGATVIEVRDRGPGLVAGSEQRVFEKFFRGSPSVAGAGLGLAICRGIVQAHGGTVIARNRPGGGSSFRVVLPQGAEPPALEPERMDPEPRAVP